MLAVRRFYLGGSLLALFLLACSASELVEPTMEAAPSAASGVKVNPPSNIGAVAGSESRIDVSWRDNSTNETGFEVHRSTAGASGAFELRGSTGPGVIGYSDGGLIPSTQYCYRVRAFRTTGNKTSYSAFSTTICATTSIAPLPAAPSGVNATPRFAGYRIGVTWTDNSTDETGFRVERSAASTGPWTAVGTTSPNATSLEDNQSLAAEQPACYRVFAFNSFGDSGPSNVDCTIVPAAPTNLAATVLGDGSVDLTWGDNSALEDGYEVMRGGGGAEGLGVVATLPANTTAYRDAGLADSSYGYGVRATKDGATSSNSNFVQVVVATRPPDAPANVDAVPAGSSVVSVSWVDVSMNEDGSRIERSTDDGASWVVAGTIGWYLLSPWFWDESRTSEEQVCYRVITFNRVGDSPPSNTDCTAPPAAPTDFTATAAGSEAVDFAWTDNSGVEDGYQIFIDYGYGYWEAIAWVGANTTSFRLEGYPNALYQLYFVAATRDGGSSDWSNSASPTSSPASSSLRTGSRSRVSPSQGSPLRRPTGRRGEP